MKIHKLLNYSGTAGIFVLWASVGVSLFVTRFDVLGKLPISYLGVYESSKYVFNGGLIIAALLLLIFLASLRAQLKLSKSFQAIFIAGQLCQIVVALTPYNSQSIGRPVHVISAFALAFSLPLSMYAFSRSAGVPKNLTQLSSQLLKIELVMFVLGIGWFILVSAAGALSEIITALVFDVWIILLSIRFAGVQQAPGEKHPLANHL